MLKKFFEFQKRERSVTMLYWIAFTAVVSLDALCVRYIFPCLLNVGMGVSLAQAFFISLGSAVVIGIVMLEIIGGLVLMPLLKRLGCSEPLAIQIVKNAYYTSAPFLCAVALVLWTGVFPGLGFQHLWPQAILAGVVLDFIDHGIVVPWFFRIADALKEKE